MKSARFFIRNDDVWTLDHEFRFYFNLAVERRIPVVHAVIPAKMDPALIDFLCKAKEKYPHLLDIVQHGWLHMNYSGDNLKKYEFGHLRSLEKQRQDINQGFKKMRQAFGDLFTPAFVPPYHGYDENTLKVIEEAGFSIFSAGINQLKTKKKFIELPAQISFSHYEQGRTSIYNAVEMVQALERNIARWALSGVLTHHADFNTEACRRELIKFMDVITGLMDKNVFRGLLFSDIVLVLKKGRNGH